MESKAAANQPLVYDATKFVPPGGVEEVGKTQEVVSTTDARSTELIQPGAPSSSTPQTDSVLAQQRRNLFQASSALRAVEREMRPFVEALSALDENDATSFNLLDKYASDGPAFGPVALSGPLRDAYSKLEDALERVGQLKRATTDLMQRSKGQVIDAGSLLQLTDLASSISLGSARELLDLLGDLQPKFANSAARILDAIRAVRAPDATDDVREEFKQSFMGATVDIAMDYATAYLNESSVIAKALESLSAQRGSYENKIAAASAALDTATQEFEAASLAAL